MEKIKEVKIKDLVQDNRNLNKGTEQGRELIQKSLREFGAGRSILLDKNKSGREQCPTTHEAMKKIFDFRFDVCFTCDRLLYDLDTRTHYCGKTTIHNPHATTCDKWRRK